MEHLERGKLFSLKREEQSFNKDLDKYFNKKLEQCDCALFKQGIVNDHV